MKPNTAPLFRDSARLCDEVLRRFEGQPGLLSQRICLHAVVLVEQVGLALARRLPRGAALDAADEALLALRVDLRLLHSRGGLDDAQLMFFAGLIGPIGKQIGGWQRQQGAV
jgi:hypothetical protein